MRGMRSLQKSWAQNSQVRRLRSLDEPDQPGPVRGLSVGVPAPAAAQLRAHHHRKPAHHARSNPGTAAEGPGSATTGGDRGHRPRAALAQTPPPRSPLGTDICRRQQQHLAHRGRTTADGDGRTPKGRIHRARSPSASTAASSAPHPRTRTLGPDPRRLANFGPVAQRPVMVDLRGPSQRTRMNEGILRTAISGARLQRVRYSDLGFRTDLTVACPLRNSTLRARPRTHVLSVC